MSKHKIVVLVIGFGVLIWFMYFCLHEVNQFFAGVEQSQNQASTSVPATKTPINNISEFDKPTILSVDDRVTFPDGLAVTLKSLEDSRCPYYEACFWPGELAGIFDASGGRLSKMAEMRLGTTYKIVSTEGYTFTLVDNTDTTITLTVDYQKPKK